MATSSTGVETVDEQGAAEAGSSKPPAIRTVHLRKEYGDIVALKNLSLEVPEGSIYGLIGPNGAGKTTLLRILATLLEPTYGEVTVAGINILETPERVHPYIGFMSDRFSLYEDLRVWEYLDHFARCYRIGPSRRKRLIDEALELVGLTKRRDTLVGALSRGMRQRLCFARTLLHQPKILLLDEPASGIDPAGRIEFRELLKELGRAGCTILISSHILTEMTDFCTHIGIIEQGELLVSGPVEYVFQQLHGGLLIRVRVLAKADRAAEVAREHPLIKEAQVFDAQVDLLFEGNREDVPSVIRLLAQHEVPMIGFEVVERDLESIYLRLASPEIS